MSFSAFLAGKRSLAAACALGALLLAASTGPASAASIHGIVTDSSGARVPGARVVLLNRGAVVTSSISAADGSFQLTTGAAGRFFVVVSAPSFRQIQTPNFYAGRFDSVERSVVLEPA